MYEPRQEHLNVLRSTPTVLRALVRGLDEAMWRRRPAPDEWSALEVVAHLADTEERAMGRIRRMLTEHDPLLPGYDPDELARERRYNEMDPSKALDRYERLRHQHVALLDGLDEDGWRRKGVHGEQGAMDVDLYISHSAGEDADHLAQIARLIPR